MKRLLLALGLLLSSGLYGEEAEEEDCSSDRCHYWQLRAHGDYVGGTDVEETAIPGARERQVHYAEGGLEASLTSALTENSGVNIGFGATFTNIEWPSNPNPVIATTFRDFDILLGGYTYRFDHWFWQTGVKASFDTTQPAFGSYGKFQGLVSGRYAYSECVGFHIGILAGAGLQKNYAYPILGFDYNPEGPWKLSAVVPTNISAQYCLCDWLSVDIRGRRFWSRNRIRAEENPSRGIVAYRSYGAELGANFYLHPFLDSRIHVGSLGGGRLEFFDARGNETAQWALEGAYYLGGDVRARF